TSTLIIFGLPERRGLVAGTVDADHLDPLPDAVHARGDVDLVADLPVVGGGRDLRDRRFELHTGRGRGAGLRVGGQRRGPGAVEELRVFSGVGGTHEIDRIRRLGPGDA